MGKSTINGYFPWIHRCFPQDQARSTSIGMLAVNREGGEIINSWVYSDCKGKSKPETIDFPIESGEWPFPDMVYEVLKQSYYHHAYHYYHHYHFSNRYVGYHHQEWKELGYKTKRNEHVWWDLMMIWPSNNPAEPVMLMMLSILFYPHPIM